MIHIGLHKPSKAQNNKPAAKFNWEYDMTPYNLFGYL
jgi:hypothetical protein